MTDAPVHLLVPDGIDDDERVSGGNIYDRRISEALRARGIDVRMTRVAATAGRMSRARCPRSRATRSC